MLKVYKDLNLPISTVDITEVLNAKGEYKKDFKFRHEWQTIDKYEEININPNSNGYILNTGHILSDGNHLIALDFDSCEDKSIDGVKKLHEIVGKNLKTDEELNFLFQVTGNKGIHLLFKVEPERFKNISSNITGLRINNKQYKIDIRAKGGCIVVEPTKYKSLKDGKDKIYLWKDKNITMDSIELLPDYFYDIIINHYLDKKDQTNNTFYDTNGIVINYDIANNPNISEAELQLFYILDKRYYDNHDEWVKLGRIIKSLNLGFDLFDQVSKTSTKSYVSRSDCYKKWKTLKVNNKIDMRTIHYLAKIQNPEKYKELIPKGFFHNVEEDKREVNEISTRYLIQETNKDLYDNNDFLTSKVNEFFNTSQYKNLTIKSPYDTGKTTLLRSIMGKFQPRRVLWISYRKTLTNDILGSFESRFQFQDYQKGNYDSDRLIIQLESIYKVMGDDDLESDDSTSSIVPIYDLIIIDEIESVLNHFNSPTFNQKSKDLFEVFYQLCDSATRVISLDGDLNNRSYNFLDNLGESINIVNNISINPKEFTLISSKPDYLNEIKSDIENNKKLVIVSMSSTECFALKTYILSFNTSLNILIYTGSSDDKVKEDLKDVLNIWSKADVVIYSPTIESGVNFDIDHFDKIYGYICPNSCSSRAFFQMLNRVRKVKDNKITILSEQMRDTNLSDSQFFNYKEVKTSLMKLEGIKNTGTYVVKDGVKKKVIKLSPYDTNYFYNKVEELNNGFKYFIPSFLKLAALKGHTVIDKMEEKITKFKDDNRKSKNDFIFETKDINEDEFRVLCGKKQRSEATEEEKRKVDKHYLKRNYGVDILDENIIKIKVSSIKDFLSLLDIENLKRHDERAKEDNQTKEKILKLKLINSFIKDIGFDHIYDTKEIKQQDLQDRIENIVKTNEIFTKSKKTKILFKLRKNTSTIENTKQLIGIFNSILIDYNVKLSSKRKGVIKGTSIKQIYYYIERINNIDEILNYRIRKGYNLKDNNNIRKDFKVTEDFKHLVDWNKANVTDSVEFDMDEFEDSDNESDLK